MYLPRIGDSWWFTGWWLPTTLWLCQWSYCYWKWRNGPVEIVDLPINSMVIFQLMNWLVVWNMSSIFPLGIIIPTDFHMFQMGRSPPTILWWDKYWFIHQAEISVVNRLSKLGGFLPLTRRNPLHGESHVSQWWARAAQDAPEIR